MKLTTLRRRRGFTLLELIVVLIVLGLLAAIAIPTFSAVIDRSEQRAVESTAEALGRDALALASIDRIAPNQVDFNTLRDELGDPSYTLTDGASWEAEGRMTVSKGNGCAVLNLGTAPTSNVTVTPCDAATAPDPLSTLDRALASVNAIAGNHTFGGGLIHPAAHLDPALTWAFENDRLAFQTMDDFTVATDEVRWFIFDEVGPGQYDAFRFYFADGSDCVMIDLFASEDEVFRTIGRTPQLSPGTCHGDQYSSWWDDSEFSIWDGLSWS